MSHQQQWDGREGREERQQASYGYAVSDYDEDYNQQSHDRNNNHYAPGPRAVPVEYRGAPPQHRPPPNRGQPNYAYPLRTQQHHPQQRPPRDLTGHQSNYRQGPLNGQHRQQHPPPPRFQRDPHGTGRRGPPVRVPRPVYIPSLPDENESGESHEPQPSRPHRQPQRPLQIQIPSAGPQPPASLGQHPAIRNDYNSIGPEASGYYGPSPSVAPLQPRAQNTQRRGNPVLRVPIPSYHTNQQPGATVSPITEESGSNPSQRVSGNSRASYASSSAIPADWESGDPPEYFALTPDASASSSSSDNIGSLPIEGEMVDTGLVRQASMGKRSRPKLTQIGGRKSSGTPSERMPASPALSSPSSEDIPRAAGANENADKSSTVAAPIKNTNASNPSLLSATSPAKTPRSARSSVSSPLAQPPITSSYFDEKLGQLDIPRSQESDTIRPLPRFERPPSSFSQRISAFFGGGKSSAPKIDRNSTTASTIYGMGMEKELGGTIKKVPPPLDMDAVRQAEARGSLTSLPDLIRRATKAAALLDNGQRPASGNWGRDSFYAGNNRSRNNTDSLSDVLNAFPAPLSSQRRNSRFSRLSGTSQPPSEHAEIQGKQRRRICGMPLWGFVLLVILVILIIAAAIIVPLYVLGFQKSNDNTVKTCNNELLKCENGGKALFENNICSCSCPDGFTGTLCDQRTADPTCTSYNLLTAGVKDASVGSSLPRLFEKAASFNIPLEPAKVLSQFESGNVGCTLQNALVTFNGRSQPEKRKRSNIVVDTSAAPSSEKSKEDPAFDFARVGLLYLAQIEGIIAAQKMQQEVGVVLAMNQVEAVVQSEGSTFRLNDKTVTLKNGTTVGGGSGGDSNSNQPLGVILPA